MLFGIDWRAENPPPHYKPGVSRGEQGFRTNGELSNKLEEVRANAKPVVETAQMWNFFDSLEKEKRERGRKFSATALITDDRSKAAALPRTEQDRLLSKLSEAVADVPKMTPADWLAVQPVGDNSLKYEEEKYQPKFAHSGASLLNAALKNTSVVNVHGTDVSADDLIAAPQKTVALDEKAIEELRSRARGGDSTAVVGLARVLREEGRIDAALKCVLGGCRQLKNDAGLWLEALSFTNGSAQMKSVLKEAVDVCGGSITATDDAQSRRAADLERLWISYIDAEVLETKQCEAARLAVENAPWSEKLWDRLFEAETDPSAQQQILKLAVKEYPHLINAWLRLSRLQTRFEAKQLLVDSALKHAPNALSLWQEAIRVAIAVQVERLPATRNSNVFAIVGKAIAATASAPKFTESWCLFALEFLRVFPNADALPLPLDEPMLTAATVHSEVAITLMVTVFPMSGSPATWFGDLRTAILPRTESLRDFFSVSEDQTSFRGSCLILLCGTALRASQATSEATAAVRLLVAPYVAALLMNSGAPVVPPLRRVWGREFIDALVGIQELVVLDDCSTSACAFFSRRDFSGVVALPEPQPGDVTDVLIRLRALHLSGADAFVTKQYINKCLAFAPRPSAQLAALIVHAYSHLNDPSAARALADRSLSQLSMGKGVEGAVTAYNDASRLYEAKISMERKYAAAPDVLRHLHAALRHLKGLQLKASSRFSYDHSYLLGLSIDLEPPHTRGKRAVAVLQETRSGSSTEAESVPPHVYLALARVYDGASRPERADEQRALAFASAESFQYGLASWCHSVLTVRSEPNVNGVLALVRMSTATPQLQARFFAGYDDVLSIAVSNAPMSWASIESLKWTESP